MPQLSSPLIVGCDDLERVLGNENLLIVEVGDEESYERHHVPDAVHVDYEHIVGMTPPATGLMPDEAQLSELFSSLGLTAERHVIAYDNDKNSLATRLLWTLDAVGHGRSSLLDGGMSAWRAGGHATEAGVNEPHPSDYIAACDGRARAEKNYILDRLGNPDVVLLDTRTPAEYAGQDVRAARGGHIPGAVNMDWTEAIDLDRFPRFKPAEQLRRMYEAIGVTPDKEIIVYCQTHHRSSHSYIVLRSLGYPRVRGYDGSWSEWGNDPDAPIET